MLTIFGITDNPPVATIAEDMEPGLASPYAFKPGPYSSHSLLLASFAPEGRGKRLLDVGCGPGFLSAILAERGYDVIGIERHAAGGVRTRIIEADIDQGFPPLPGRFDYVLCADILEHLREPSRCLSEIRRLLAPGGALIASLPNSGHFYFRANVVLGRFPWSDRGLFDRTHLHFFGWKGWQELLSRAGFSVESVKSTGTPFGLAVPVLEPFEAISYAFAKAWKTLFAYQFIVVARPQS